jgi:NADH-quinone oxidoreductase subunit L
MTTGINIEALFHLLGIVVVASPALLVVVLGLKALTGFSMTETAVKRWTYVTTLVGLLAALAILFGMLRHGERHVAIELGNWVVIPEQHFHFHLKFVFDRLSVPFCILSFVLCGTVSAFSRRYLHREPGFGRFFVCYSFFTLGMILTSLAGTIEVLFFGWELVGLSSALLVAYFHERPAPVRNGIRVWSVYRIADAAFLIAAVMLHHYTGEGDFAILTGSGPWPFGHAAISSGEALAVGLFLLVAAAGKSALVPFSGWLPRAMEGPTPSSAIFYGALSVHLGAFLLLRVSPILELSLLLSAAVVGIGLVTALYATMAGRVQTDIKTALTFASLAQVGIIVAEIGFGLRYIALIHIIGHACLRTLQLLRAPTLLHDYHTIENAIGGRPPAEPGFIERMIPEPTRDRWFRFAFERGYLDAVLDLYLVGPFKRVFQWCDRSERGWTDWLSGGHSRVSDDVEVHSEIVEDLRH